MQGDPYAYYRQQQQQLYQQSGYPQQFANQPAAASGVRRRHGGPSAFPSTYDYSAFEAPQPVANTSQAFQPRPAIPKPDPEPTPVRRRVGLRLPTNYNQPISNFVRRKFRISKWTLNGPRPSEGEPEDTSMSLKDKGPQKCSARSSLLSPNSDGSYSSGNFPPIGTDYSQYNEYATSFDHLGALNNFAGSGYDNYAGPGQFDQHGATFRNNAAHQPLPTMGDMMGEEYEMDDEEEEEDDGIFPKMSSQQKMKVGLALLMIPSLIVILSSQKKFSSSSSNSNVDMAALKAGGFGGGFAGMGGGGGGGAGLGALGHYGSMGGHGGYGMDDDDMGMGYPPGAARRRGRRPYGQGHRRGRTRHPMPGVDDDMDDEGQEAEPEDDGPPRPPPMDADPPFEKLDPENGAASDPNPTTTELPDTIEVTLEPEQRQEFDDYYDSGDLPFPEQPSFDDLLSTGLDGLPPKHQLPKPRGNPDPELVVEQEKLDPLLLQAGDGSSTLLDSAEASIARLREQGFRTVLGWSAGQLGRVLPEGPRPFNGCPTSKCTVTFDKSQLSNADALVIDSGDESDLPILTSGQRSVLYVDSPASKLSGKLGNASFDWRWSYRRDADIRKSLVFFQFAKNANKKDENQLHTSRAFELWRKKKRMVMVLWDGTDCSRNDSLVQALANLTDVDLLGKCGKPAKCNTSELNCMKQLAKEYFFAIDLNAGNCSTRITENVANMFESTIVPILADFSNLSLPSPANSVVNAQTFATAADLADFLNNVATDFNNYLRLINWRFRYRMLRNQRADLCKLCKLLHQPNEQQSARQPAAEWIQRDQCLKHPMSN